VGFHLGEACRNLAELGLVTDRERDMAAEAAQRLAAAAEAALVRGDAPAGARLLERAASLLEPHGAARVALLPALGAALAEAGRMADAAQVLDEAIAGAPDPRLRARAEVERELVRLESETSAGTEEAGRVADAALPILEGDDEGRCRALLLRAQPAWIAGRADTADEAWSEAAESARRAGNRRELFEVVGWRASAAALGPTPVDAAIRLCEELGELVRASPVATASTLNPLALLHAMKGDFDTAELLLGRAGEMLRELRGVGAGVSHLEAWVRMLAGEPELAEGPLRADVEMLSSMNATDALATTTALLAQVVYAQGRLEEAAELCRMTDRHAAAEDTLSQAIWRGVQAKVLVREGSADEAEDLAREGVALMSQTDLLSLHGDAILDLAEVLRTRERIDEADRAAQTALELYEIKGNATAVGRARLVLTERQGGE
jgi:ATP/maltotriose-dependent transcriptional regulator MalT